MKKLLFLFVFAVAALTTAAQDKLITTDGDVYVVYNVEVTGSSVMYTISNSATADIQKIEKSKVLIIKRPDGSNYDLGTTEAPSKMVTTDGDVKQIYVVELGTDIVYYKDAETPYSEVQNINKSDVLMIKKADGTNYDLGAINTSSSEITSSSTLFESTTSTTSTATSSTSPTGLLCFEYLGIGLKGINGISVISQSSYVHFGVDFNWTEGFDNTTYRMSLGGYYGGWIENVLYISGCIGVYLGESDGFLYGLLMTPRVAIKLGDSFCITGSYRYDFGKFKFKEAYNTDYFTVGLGFAF